MEGDQMGVKKQRGKKKMSTHLEMTAWVARLSRSKPSAEPDMLLRRKGPEYQIVTARLVLKERNQDQLEVGMSRVE